jgi:hypothetical protein
MEIRYKLTTQKLTTYNGCQWALNEWKETDGFGKLCAEGWLHCYTNPLLAILFNYIHADISNPRLFEVEVEGKCLTDLGKKEGWTRMRLVKEIEVPVISHIQRIAFGILCAKKVCKDKQWNKWADKWLSGEDRSETSAKAVYDRYNKIEFFSLAQNACASTCYAAGTYDGAKSIPSYAVMNDAANISANAADAAICAVYSEGSERIDWHICLIKLANEAMKYE